MKTKNYEVVIKAFSSVLVFAAKDEKQAIEFAEDEVSTTDWSVCEHEVRELKEDEIETVRGCANAVSGDEE